MQNVPYMDLRMYLGTEPHLEVLGICKLEVADIMNSVIGLHSAISSASINDESKQALLNTPLGELLGAMQLLAQQTITEADKQVSEEANELRIAERNQLVRTNFITKGQALCPECGVRIHACDGVLQCLACKTTFGEI